MLAALSLDALDGPQIAARPAWTRIGLTGFGPPSLSRFVDALLAIRRLTPNDGKKDCRLPEGWLPRERLLLPNSFRPAGRFLVRLDQTEAALAATGSPSRHSNRSGNWRAP